MPNDDSNDSEARMDAWLQGSLPPEQSEALEKELQSRFVGADQEAQELDHALLALNYPREEAPNDALQTLVSNLRNERSSKVIGNGWEQLLRPSAREGSLGSLGTYVILEVISIGSMGIVLKAFDHSLNRIVAIKMLAPELAMQTRSRERFLREARAVASLEHENILPIHGVYTEPVPWIAMRYAPGGSLQEALDRGDPFDLERLRSIARQITRALDAAHAKGIIHRDIKPANILLDEGSYSLWVCDFGIARSLDEPSLTLENHIAGTPHYMSPEQARGEPLDGRSDLFSLGALLYRCATGELAFPGNTTAAALHRITTEDPKPSERLNPKLPPWIHRLLGNLLAKDPRDRFQNTRAVVRAIDEQRAPKPRKRSQRLQRWTRLAIGTLLILGVIAGLLQIPSVAYRVNLAIAEVSSRDIVLTDRIGAYHSLQQAIDQASADAILEFASEGPFRIDRTEIPPNKPLTLRPTGRFVPLLEVHEAAEAGLTTYSDLRLERLSLTILSPRDRGFGILRVGQGLVTVDRCLFVARYQPSELWNTSLQSTVEIIGDGHLDIRDTLFRVDSAKAIVIGGDHRDSDFECSIRIHNSYLEGNYAFTFDDIPPRLKLEMTHCLCVGQIGFWNPRGVPIPSKLHLRASNNIFGLNKGLLWFSNQPAEAVQASLDWEGSNNLHREDAPFFMNQPGIRRQADTVIQGLPAWRAFTGSSLEECETKSYERPTMYGIARVATPESVGRYVSQFGNTQRGPDSNRMGPDAR